MYVVGMYIYEGLLTMFLFQNQVNSTVCVSLLIVYIQKSTFQGTLCLIAPSFLMVEPLRHLAVFSMQPGLSMILY